MKKFVVALLIVGAFILYSFLYHSSTAALLPTGSTDSSSSTRSSSTSTASSTNAASSATPSATGTSGSGSYKDGTYTGSVADATWGNVQVQAVIQNGKITSVQFLQYPNDRSRSIAINSYADPQLSNEAIQAQSANVDVVTGATDTSDAFIQSLTDALSKAK
jgi:uncharacterized protein with FMN-binding domain